MIPHDKLFIPGPVEVSEKTLAAFSRPMIGHRGQAFKDLCHEIHPRLQALLPFHLFGVGRDGGGDS